MTTRLFQKLQRTLDAFAASHGAYCPHRRLILGPEMAAQLRRDLFETKRYGAAAHPLVFNGIPVVVAPEVPIHAWSVQDPCCGHA